MKHLPIAMFLFFSISACAPTKEISQVDFNLENCLRIINNVNHPLHNDEFAVIGCNHFIADYEEQQMRENAQEENQE